MSRKLTSAAIQFLCLLWACDSGSFLPHPDQIPTKLAFIVQPAPATSGAAMSLVVVTVQDVYGNTVANAGMNVTVALGTNRAGGTLLGATTVAAVNGVAVFSNLSIDRSGKSYTFTASSAGLTVAISSPFDVAPVPIPRVAFLVQPSTSLVGRAIKPAIQVAIQDANGNTIANSSTLVTVALKDSVGTAVTAAILSGTVTVVTVNGVATFPDLSIDTAATGYILWPSVDGYNGLNRSDQFMITALPLAFASVSAGGGHTCGVTPAHAALCWGSNSSGQLGNGPGLKQVSGLGVTDPLRDSTSPIGAVYYTGCCTPSELSFGSVSAAANHTCGTTITGEAHCWGWGPDGNGGAGSLWNPDGPAVDANGLTVTFAAVTAGGQIGVPSNPDSMSPEDYLFSHVCGVTTAGKAYCYGSNNSGQLGDGTTDFGWLARPVLGGLSFANVSAGGALVPTDGPAYAGAYTCGVTTPGAAYCWGNNTRGQLGDGTTTNRTSPVAVLGGLTFAAVSTGGDHACGVTIAGAAYCWGDNASGKLGDGTTTSRASPLPVSGGLTFEAVSAGGSHTCGVTVGGAAYCWGDNSSGQLGDGTTTNRTNPSSVLGGLNFAAVSAGASHTCGVTTAGIAYCWGDNSFGQLGDATTTGSNVPVEVADQP